MKPFDACRRILGWVCLVLQLAGIGHAQIAPGHLFAWAPFHEVRQVCLRVVVAGRSLTPAEIKSRYRITLPVGQSIADTRICVRQYETTYGKDDGARVTLGSLRNGHQLEIWSWPPRP